VSGDEGSTDALTRKAGDPRTSTFFLLRVRCPSINAASSFDLAVSKNWQASTKMERWHALSNRYSN
jgi:hypothetical protein